MKTDHGCPGDQETIKEVVFPGELAQIGIFFGQRNKMMGRKTDSHHFQSFKKIQEQGVCLDEFAGLVGKTKRVVSKSSNSSKARRESGSMVSSRKGLFPRLAAGRRKMLSSPSLETPMVTKTTRSKPAGAIFAARVTTRASNGPNCPGRSSQPRLLSMDSALVIFRRPQGSVLRPEPGEHILGKEVLQLTPIGSF
jgi:hypothetical protein